MRKDAKSANNNAKKCEIRRMIMRIKTIIRIIRMRPNLRIIRIKIKIQNAKIKMQNDNAKLKINKIQTPVIASPALLLMIALKSK
jgi:hypothetical protein